MDGHDEEETFRLLIKSTYEEVYEAWLETKARNLEDMKKDLIKFGWTVDEFYGEWWKRNRGRQVIQSS